MVIAPNNCVCQLFVKDVNVLIAQLKFDAKASVGAFAALRGNIKTTFAEYN
jgi:hypothetical protein